LKSKVTLVGIGDDGAEGLGPAALAAIESADVLVGGSRHLGFFPDFPGETWRFDAGVSTLTERILARATGHVVVLASGDPLFFGIGGVLAKKLGPDAVSVIPAVSSMQWAFARMGLAWQDAGFFSVHGRSPDGLAQRLNRYDKAAVLTDDVHTPAVLAQYLLDFGMTEYRAFVGERLGGPAERSRWYSLEEMVDGNFEPLNLVVFVRDPGTRPVWPLGIDDEAFSQRKPDRGLITKREVRVMAISALRPKPGEVLWDIGACTGSVSIEAILLEPTLTVYAIEKNAEDLNHLRTNQRRFRTDFVAVQGRAPDGLDRFSDPDAVFVGGSGGELPVLLELVGKRLKAGGRIVIPAATLETLAQAHQILGNLGFSVAVTLIQTARSRPILELTRLEGMNPVFLLAAERPS